MQLEMWIYFKFKKDERQIFVYMQSVQSKSSYLEMKVI